MLKRAIKYFVFLTITTLVVMPITAVVVDDDTVIKILKDVPGGTSHIDDIITRKKLLVSTITNYLDDTLFNLEVSLLETSQDALSRFKVTYTELFNISLPEKSSKKVVVYLANQSKTNSQTSSDNTPTQKEPSLKPKIVNITASKLIKSPMKLKTKQAQLPAAQKQKKLKSKNKTLESIKKKKSKAVKLDARIISAKKDHQKGLKFYKVKNFKKASQWFLQAAKKGYAGAQYNLGVMSYLGQGKPKNYSQAANWFEKAGNQDHATAQYNLGYIYYEGKGVEKDNLQAYMWIDRSANLGDKKAILARDTMQIVLPKNIFN